MKTLKIVWNRKESTVYNKNQSL